MKKIGIITLNGYFNYGNRLQNYALQESIKSLGYMADTIILQQGERDNRIDFNKENLNKILLRIKVGIKNPLFHKRQSLFIKFTKGFINEVIYKKSEESFKEVDNNYDFFVVGSDQVWNPYYMEDSELFFLSFTKNHKKIAYAPSFGVNRIPKKYINEYRNGLSQFKCLSAREELGVKIIADITKREANVVLDPTFLLTKEQWIGISVPSVHKPKVKYLLTYFLGEKSNEMKEYIHRIAKIYGLKIINLAEVKDKKGYVTGPLEFIDYIKDASVLFTDSYHGSIFSILLETPFVVMERKGDRYSMNSRLETLLKIFHLESRRYEYLSHEPLFIGHYENIETILEEERKKAFDYLEHAFLTN
jgi:hypothetical protein